MPLPQGDLGLLDSDVAQRLLSSTLNARLAYTGTDGMPRVLPIWFHWTGDELVMCSMAGASKAAALRAHPDVAITIDTDGFPADVLLLRGPATVTDVDGVADEYAQAARRYMGEEGAAQWLDDLERRGARMHRIGVRPTWAAVLDFQTRFPRVLGGIQE
jgi:PPOX class probable F420-dependent enzyme